jgi:hypothetical protein
MYVWEYSQKHCPDSIVQLYVDNSKVLTKSSTSFTGGLAIVEGKEKNQVVTLELTETLLLCDRSEHKTHISNILVFFHPMPGLQVASGKFSTVKG